MRDITKTIAKLEVLNTKEVKSDLLGFGVKAKVRLCNKRMGTIRVIVESKDIEATKNYFSMRSIVRNYYGVIYADPFEVNNGDFGSLMAIKSYKSIRKPKKNKNV
jgi:hypothetical protein